MSDERPVWEYLVLTFPHQGDLDKLGKEHWELVAVVREPSSLGGDMMVAYLKRRRWERGLDYGERDA